MFGPGHTLGMLGDGQLGRLMAIEAGRLGVDVQVYGSRDDSPTARVSEKVWVAPWDDEATLRAFADAVDVVTYEWENVPVAAVRFLASCGVPVLPRVEALRVAQDRLLEKELFRRLGANTVAYVTVDRYDDLVAGLARLGGAGILKRRRDGYDGKGQVRIPPGADPRPAWERLAGAPLILEAIAPFEREISVIAARDVHDRFIAWCPPENEHRDGILYASRVPARLSAGAAERATAITARIARALDYVGVLAVEFFVLPGERLLVNEFAPRVHNSGHWTPEACATGQFAQHVRAVLGWPLASVHRHSDCRMQNLLGDAVHDWPRLVEEGAHVTIYGKREVRPGRKMGHAVWLTPRAF